MANAKHTLGPWRVSEQCAQMIDIRHDNNEAGAISQTLAKVVARPSWQQVAEANARLIAAAPELLEALVWREQFEAREGEGSNDRFERVAEIFRRETGYLRPGKDCRIESMEVRQQAWEEWLRAGNERARAAIAKATGAAQ